MLSERVAIADALLLCRQQLLRAVSLCQPRHTVDKVNRRLIELRQQHIHLVLDASQLFRVQAHLIAFIHIQFVLLRQKILQTLQALLHRLHLGVGTLLQPFDLLVERFHRLIDILFTTFTRGGSRELQALVSKDSDTASLPHQRRSLREGTLRIVALDHDATGLSHHLRSVAHHVLLTVDAGIHRRLTDSGRTGHDLSLAAHALQREAVSFHDHRTATVYQVAAVIDVSYHAFRG